MSETLFPDLVPVISPGPTATPEPISADRRRTLRQRADVAAGRHPLTRGRLTDKADATCGNCRFREPVSHNGNRSFPKCVRAYPLYITGGAATDVRAWWPGCTEHEWGDPKLSPDAMRSGPATVNP